MRACVGVGGPVPAPGQGGAAPPARKGERRELALRAAAAAAVPLGGDPSRRTRSWGRPGCALGGVAVPCRSPVAVRRGGEPGPGTPSVSPPCPRRRAPVVPAGGPPPWAAAAAWRPGSAPAPPSPPATPAFALSGRLAPRPESRARGAAPRGRVPRRRPAGRCGAARRCAPSPGLRPRRAGCPEPAVGRGWGGVDGVCRVVSSSREDGRAAPSVARPRGRAAVARGGFGEGRRRGEEPGRRCPWAVAVGGCVWGCEGRRSGATAAPRRPPPPRPPAAPASCPRAPSNPRPRLPARVRVPPSARPGGSLPARPSPPPPSPEPGRAPACAAGPCSPPAPAPAFSAPLPRRWGGWAGGRVRGRRPVAFPRAGGPPSARALSRPRAPPLSRPPWRALRDATSDQTWRPAEFKHISQRRKRN